uniref:Uncharacterized protein n=1 Tax=Cannabis sativa TaxID=3483 RepID=A0A803R0X1_CANSA
MSVQVTSASEASSEAAVGVVAVIVPVPPPPRSSGSGRNVPPRSMVSTAAWHMCQFPVQSRPTAPLTGFTVRPHASNNSD